MSHVATLFEELPYAAALNDEFLANRCSNCFRESSTPCHKCKQVVYCDDRCSEVDWPWHEIECTAGPGLIGADIRLMARFGRRRQIDGGGASLSTKFPSTYKPRTCKDLKAHFRDISRDKKRQGRLRELWNRWQEVLAGSPLSTMKKNDVQRLYCILCINTFGIVEEAMATGCRSWRSVGVGLYLNASRFNHSCRPDVYVLLSGTRMSIVKPMGENEKMTTMKEKDFNRLTVNYGVPPREGHNSLVLSTRQRIESLRSRYYFKCQCVKCADKTAQILEENAASVECSKCKMPYIWNGRPMKLSVMCNCSGGRRKLDPVDQVQVQQLDSMWERVMTETDDTFDTQRVIEVCKPMWLLAKKFWHPVVNLRLAQLSERLFRAYVTKITGAGNDVKVDDRIKDVKMAVTTGEIIVAGYGERLRNNAQLAALYTQLAAVYGILGGDENSKMAIEWYTKAADAFRCIGDEANSSLVLSWQSKLSSGTDSSTLTPPSSMNILEIMGGGFQYDRSEL